MSRLSKLWKWVDKRKLSEEGKVRLFLFLNCMFYGIQGLFTWLFVSRFTLDSWDWAFCFAGYPGLFLGYLGGFIYLCRK